MAWLSQTPATSMGQKHQAAAGRRGPGGLRHRPEPGHTPAAMKDLVRMRERPLFTAAFVFSSPSFVPSLAAFMSFCICERGENVRSSTVDRNPLAAVILKEYCQASQRPLGLAL